MTKSGSTAAYASKFEVGAIVRLIRAESPAMAVTAVSAVNMKREYTRAQCIWFDKNHVLHESNFPMTLLEEVPK